jgi:hypothetical protein
VCLGTKLLEELERQLLMGNLFGIQTKQAMWDFKFSRRRVWYSELSSGMYCRVKWLSTDVSLMMEAVRTSETSVDNHFTRQYIPEDSSEHRTSYVKQFKFKASLLTFHIRRQNRHFWWTSLCSGTL